MNKKYQGRLEELAPKKKMPASEALLIGNENRKEDDMGQTRLVLKIMESFNELTPEYQHFVLKEMGKAKKRPTLPQSGSQKTLSLNETAYFLNVNPRTIHNWLKKGLIHGVKKNGKWYFEREEVQRISDEKK